MEKTYNEAAIELFNQALYIATEKPDLVKATMAHHRCTLEQAMMLTHLIRHLGMKIVSPETLNREYGRLEALKESMTFEKGNIAEGSLSKDYIQGIEDTLNSLYRDIHM